MMYIDVGSGRTGAGGAAGAGARVVSARPPPAPRPPPPAPPPPPGPPRPWKGCGIAKPVGTTIDGVPTTFVTDVFSAGVKITSYFSNRSHHFWQSSVRARLAF